MHFTIAALVTGWRFYVLQLNCELYETQMLKHYRRFFSSKRCEIVGFEDVDDLVEREEDVTPTQGNVEEISSPQATGEEI